MMQMLKILTGAALVILLIVTAAGNLSSLAPKIPQDLISAAKVFALYGTLLLSVGLVVAAVIIGHAVPHEQRFMLRTLSRLAVLAAAASVHRLLPYLTGIPRADGDDLLLATFIALALAWWWLLARPRG